MSLAPMSRPLLLAFALVVLGGVQAGEAAPGGGKSQPPGERREAMLRQQAEAINRLSDRQRQAYFTELERLEQRRSRDQLEQLSQTRRCMEQARELAAVEHCQRAMQEQRRQQRRQLRTAMAELRQRYGLPGWRGRKDDQPGPKGA